jgi:hypothetical protein
LESVAPCDDSGLRRSDHRPFARCPGSTRSGSLDHHATDDTRGEGDTGGDVTAAILALPSTPGRDDFIDRSVRVRDLVCAAIQQPGHFFVVHGCLPLVRSMMCELSCAGSDGGSHFTEG